MAKITELTVLNPSDKTRMYAVATGKGAPTDVDDVLVTDLRTYPVGSQYTDLTGSKFYVRTKAESKVADWVNINAAAAG